MNHILLIEDDPGHVLLISRIIKDSDIGAELHVVGALGEASEWLKLHHPILLLSDLNLPDGNAISFLKEYLPEHNFPIVVLTSHGDEQMAVEIMKAGASDYLVKSENLFFELPKIIRHALREWNFQMQKIQAEEKLKIEKQKFENLFELGADVILLIRNSDGQLLECNKMAEELYGFTHDELLRKKNSELSAEPDETRRITETTPVIKENIVHIPLRWHKKKGGTVFPVEINGRFFEWNGEPVHMAMIRDISERKNAEKEIKKYQKQFESFFNHHDAVFLLMNGNDGRIINANDAALKFYGYSLPQIKALKISDINKLSPEALDAERQRALREEKKYFIVPHQLANGEIRTVEVHTTPVSSEDEVFLFSVIFDVTDRQRAEKEVFSQKNTLDAIFESSPFIMLLADSNARVIKINRTGANYVGKNDPEIINHLCGNVFNCKHSFEGSGCGTTDSCVECVVRKSLNKTIRTGNPVNNEEGSLTCIASGEEVMIDVLVSTNLVKQADGNKVLISINDITERKHIKEILHETEERLRLVLNSSPITIFATDMEGNFILHEGLGTYKVGMYPGFNVGKSAFELFDSLKVIEPSGKITNGEDVLKRVLGGETMSGITELNGVFFENQFSPILNLNREISGFVGVAFDISDRIKAENKLRESETLFSTIFYSSLFPVSLSDMASEKWVEVNQAFLDITGYTREEIIGNTFRDINLWKHIGDRIYMRKTLIEHGRVDNFEVEINKKDGSNGTMLISVEKVDIAGTPFLLIMGNEITNRIKAEKIIVEQEKKYRTIFENIQDTYYETTLDGIMLEISPSIKDLTYGQYSRDDIIGRSIVNLYSDPAQREKLIVDLKEKGSVNDYEITLVNRDGTLIPCSIMANLFYNENGQPEKIIGTLRNIYERKMAEQEQSVNYHIQKTISSLLSLSLINNSLEELLQQTFILLVSIPCFSFEQKGCIFLFEDDQLVMKYFMGISEQVKEICNHIPFGKCICGKAALEQKLIFTDCVTEQHQVSIPGIPPHGHYCVPIYYENKTIGLINIYLKSGHKYNEKEASFLEDAAKMLASIIIRKQSEFQLKESEELYHAVIDTSIDGFWIINKDRNILESNKAYCDLLGYTQQEMLKMNIKDLVAPEISDEADARSSEIMKRGFARFESKHKRKNGDIIDVEVSVNYYAPKKKFFSFLRDITQRKRTERELKIIRDELQKSLETQEIINSLLHDTITDLTLNEILKIAFDKIVSLDWLSFEKRGCIFIVDENNPEHLNIRVHSNLSQPIITLCGRLPFGACLCGKAALEQKTQFQNCLNDLHTIRYEGIMEHGHYCVPIVYENRTLGVINVYVKHGHIYDSTEENFLLTSANALASIIVRKLAEESLKKAYDNQEIIIKQRTIELAEANTQLQIENEERQKVIEKEKELNAMKSGFISVISHEFRTPLAGILSSIDLLKRYGNKWDEEKKEKLYSSIKGAVNYTNILLDDVAIIGKDESGKLKFKPVMIDTKEFYSQIADESSVALGTSDRIRIKDLSKRSIALIDVYLMRHVLHNLLNNAIKYSSPETIVEFTISDSSKRHICFEVKDKGIGIPEKDIQHIFEKFHRAQNVEGIKGTGIGLSIVKRCTELHGGTVDITSKVGEGTTVRIIIPVE